VSGPANTLWARAWVDELARCGVREIAVAPGSRSTPLVLAFARDGRFRMRVHLDERSAAFFALGVGKATGVPAAVVTTSGSAVANLFPAVVEANQAETPLLVLTADRPPRLRGSDANQAIDQGRIFGTYARAFFEAGPPAASGPELRHLRQMACRAVDAAGGPPAGAVHVNFPFDKPLEPLERGMDALAAEHPLAVRGRPDGRRFTAVARSDGVPSADAVARVAEICAAGRGLVVAGPSTDPARIGPAVLRFAERAGFPVLADPLSGARFGPDHGALRIAVYDLLLRAPAARTALAPEVIVRVGSSPTSAVLQDWLVEQNGTPYAVADAGLRWKDHGATATEYLAGDPVATLELLGDALEEGLRPDGRREVGWAGLWRAVDGAVRGVLAEADEDSEPTHEGALWPRLARALPEAVVFVSSSMPVRDLDVFGVPEERAWTVFGNRGASGIDGVVSTAFGVAAGRGRPVVCVLGDLALFHDQNGLLWSREADLSVVFVLVDNDGGGIFHMLPIVDHEPHFTTFFATPHGLDFRHAAQLHAIDFRDVTPATLTEEVAGAAGRGGTSVLRLRTDRVAARTRRAEIASAVAEAVTTALSSNLEEKLPE
jgi:2-succinyl-5-enolpyruvyl-6-hydroxy-3-cyclohexene-1-carboxylate synthase